MRTHTFVGSNTPSSRSFTQYKRPFGRMAELAYEGVRYYVDLAMLMDKRSSIRITIKRGNNEHMILEQVVCEIHPTRQAGRDRYAEILRRLPEVLVEVML